MQAKAVEAANAAAQERTERLQADLRSAQDAVAALQAQLQQQSASATAAAASAGAVQSLQRGSPAGGAAPDGLSVTGLYLRLQVSAQTVPSVLHLWSSSLCVAHPNLTLTSLPFLLHADGRGGPEC
jgi:hypothetical protein